MHALDTTTNRVDAYAAALYTPQNHAHANARRRVDFALPPWAGTVVLQPFRVNVGFFLIFSKMVKSDPAGGENKASQECHTRNARNKTKKVVGAEGEPWVRFFLFLLSLRLPKNAMEDGKRKAWGPG